MERLTASGRSSGAAGSRSSGFTLVALVIFIAVLNVLVAAALPLWSQAMRREKEEELIFRGLQYAEAIRVFQVRFGRYPVRLEELIEVHPRCIRQLWKDPMSPNGEWGLVFAQAAAGQQVGPGGRGLEDDEGDDEGQAVGGAGPARRRRSFSRQRGRGGRGGRDQGGVETTGPILGVHSLSEERAVKSFAGGQTYKEWLFTVNLLPAPPPAGVENVPSLNSRWIGRPFPAGLEPEEGTGPGGAAGISESEDGRRSRPERRGRKKRRGRRNDG